MSCHSGRSAEKEREEGREEQKRNKDRTREGERSRGREGGREEGRGLRKVGKFKAEDLCRLESIRLVTERLNVK